jgi:hypothetical protein
VPSLHLKVLELQRLRVCRRRLLRHALRSQTRAEVEVERLGEHDEPQL